MYKKIKLFGLVLLGLVFVGCANIKTMPLQVEQPNLQLADQSILVGRLNIQNKNAKSWQPNLLAVFVKQDKKNYSFNKPTLITHTPKVGKDYLFSLELEPGSADLNLIRFHSRSLLVNGIAEIKFQQPITFPKKGAIVYIGNIQASIVKHQEGQPTAGPVIPLIDQAVTGFSTGSFVIDITDNYEEDIKLLLEKYPYLKGKEIQKAILPQWSHAKK